jgi:SAM-dependent methyltransferase
VVPPRRYHGVPGRVHFNDFMFDDASPEGIASYTERGLNVIEEIEASLESAGLSFDDVDRWLDFGCGYGRVVRFLVERVPPDRISAADVIGQAVEFCRSEFGVRAIHLDGNLEANRLGSYDFIYAISVVSHLNERNSVAFLRLLGESLAPNGILVFTTHGQTSLEHPERYGPEFAARKAAIGRALAERGICFLRYRHLHGDDYGVTWHAREYIEATMGELHGGRLDLMLFDPHGLDGHQDVFAFRRAC